MKALKHTPWLPSLLIGGGCVALGFLGIPRLTTERPERLECCSVWFLGRIPTAGLFSVGYHAWLWKESPSLGSKWGWAGVCGCEMHMHKHRGISQLMSAQPNNRGGAGGVFPSLFWEEGGGRTYFSPSPLVLAFRHSLQSWASCIWVNNVIICFQKWFGTNSSWKSFPRSYISVSFISQAGGETSWLGYISFPSPAVSCLPHWDRTT